MLSGYEQVAGQDALIEVKRTSANISASATDGIVIAAVVGKKLRILALALMAGATATDATLNSKGSGSGTAISPKFACGVNGGISLPYNPHGWMQTASGEALSLTTGAGSSVGVIVTYAEVP